MQFMKMQWDLLMNGTLQKFKGEETKQKEATNSAKNLKVKCSQGSGGDSDPTQNMHSLIFAFSGAP